MGDDNLQPLPPPTQGLGAHRWAYSADDMRAVQREAYEAGMRAALAAQSAQTKCSCGDREASECPGEWEPGCDLGANPKYAIARPVAQPVVWNFAAFEDWWQEHGKHNAARAQQPKAAKALMRLAWDVARERAAPQPQEEGALDADKWRQAINEALIVGCIGTAEPGDDPRRKLADLIAWETKIALDPAVSSEAQALIERGRAEAIAETKTGRQPNARGTAT